MISSPSLASLRPFVAAFFVLVAFSSAAFFFAGSDAHAQFATEEETKAKRDEWQERYRWLLRDQARIKQNVANLESDYIMSQRRNYPRGANRERLVVEAEAQRKFDELNELVLPHISLGQLRRMLGVDLTGQDLDAPFPRHLVDFESRESQSSRFKLIIDIVDRENATLRQLINRLAGARGHWVPVGTPVQIADLIEQWFRSGAADGFNVMPPAFPDGFEGFLDEVLPILRKRGLFRTEYAGSTLRDHYGLSRPASRFALKTA